MNWIKKNPAQFALALVSALILGLAFMLYTSYSSFAGNFTGSQSTPELKNKPAALDTAIIDDAAKKIAQPVIWTSPVEPPPTSKPVRLFAADAFVLRNESGENKIVRPEGGMFFPPVPNAWFDKYGIPYLDGTCLTDDPDKDGFQNVDEYLGNDRLSHFTQPPGAIAPAVGADGKPMPDDSTSPIDPKLHPAYHTRLRLDRVQQVPFNFKFMAYDLNPRKPNDINVQINAGGRTLFVPVPGEIERTKYKVKAFKKVEKPGADGVPSDVSELTVTNKETNKDLVLVLNVITPSPDSYAILRYLWVAPGGQPTPDMTLKIGATFSIPPELDKKYTLEAIGPDTALGLVDKEVLIKLPEGGTIKLKVEPK